MGSDDPYDHGAMGGRRQGIVDRVVGRRHRCRCPVSGTSQDPGQPAGRRADRLRVGWLASSLLPATEKEQEAAGAVKDEASEHSDTLTAPIKEAAGNAKENLAHRPRTRSVGQGLAATDAAGTVKDEAAAAKDDVTGNGSTSYSTTKPRPGHPASCATAGPRCVR